MIEFLTEQFHKGLGYSSLNTARGALSSMGITFGHFTAGTHPDVVRFMKGVFNLRPPCSRYAEIWDVDKVLRYLQKLSPVRHLNLKDLTLKLTMLLALVNAARVQTVHLLSTVGLKKLRSEFIVQFDSLLKQSRPSFDCSRVHLKAFPPDRRLCIYTVLKEYLKRTKPVRTGTENKLLISYVKPYQAVSRDTVTRWIKTVMLRSGIDTDIYGAHSVRAATTSKAKFLAVPIADIMKKAGWSQASTFARFYDKEIDRGEAVTKAILKL